MLFWLTSSGYKITVRGLLITNSHHKLSRFYLLKVVFTASQKYFRFLERCRETK